MSLKTEKTELREKYKDIRKNMSDDEKERLDEKIANRFLTMWAFRDCETLLCYVSKKIEVSTEEIIREAWRLGKKIAVPRCVDGTREMEFFFIGSYDDLRPGAYGLLEPDVQKCDKLTDLDGGLCLVPALAFDTQGYRLGFGKGYYDRFLAGFGGVTAGICYSSCVCEKLPGGKYDRKVDILITEKKLYR